MFLNYSIFDSSLGMNVLSHCIHHLSSLSGYKNIFLFKKYIYYDIFTILIFLLNAVNTSLE